MSDAIAVVISMAIVVGMAAGILFLLDGVTLRSDLSVEEGKAKVRERTARWQRRRGTFYLIAAVIACGERAQPES